MDYHEYVRTVVYDKISPYIKNTPVLLSSYYSQITGSEIYFKCENLQYTNSFKIRGAFHKILGFKNKKDKIMIASSGGNHGLAVSFAAKKFGLKAVIVLPEFVPKFRIEMIRSLGAEVIVHGKTMDDLNEKVAEFTIDPNYIYIHPFDDDDIMAGQGTIAHELLQEISDIDIILASVGGGGLISGIAQYAKSFNPRIKIYGVQTAGADAMSQSLMNGKIVAIPKITSIATSLGATKVTDRTFEIVKKYIESVVKVTDEESIFDLKAILEKEKLLVEPAASCNISAITSGKIPDIKGKKIAVILCGGNFSLEQVRECL